MITGQELIKLFLKSRASKPVILEVNGDYYEIKGVHHAILPGEKVAICLSAGDKMTKDESTKYLPSAILNVNLNSEVAELKEA